MMNSKENLLQILTCLLLLSLQQTTALTISTSGCGGTSFIPGEELTLHCNGGTQWRFNGSSVIDPDMFKITPFFSNNVPLSSTLQFKPSYTNQHSGNYTCFTTIEETSINITTQTYTLNITGTIPSIINDALQLTCELSTQNRTDNTYQWKHINTMGETRTLNSTVSVLNIPSVSEDDVGMFECQVTTCCNGEYTTSINIAIMIPPVVTGPISNTYNVRKSSNITLYCNITGEQTNFSWTTPMNSNERIITDSQSGILTLMNTKFTDTGSYVCTGENQAGAVNQTHEIIVLGKPEIISEDNLSYEFIVGESITLPCHYVGNPTPLLSWKHYLDDSSEIVDIVDDNRRFISEEDDLIISSLILNDNGVYQCNVSNEYGFETISYTLAIYGIPDAPSDLTSDTKSESADIRWNNDYQSMYTTPDYFIVEISTDSGNTFNESEVPSNINMLQFENLIPNTEYIVRIFAINRAGKSQPSQHLVFTTSTTVPQLVFFNVTSADNGRSFLFQWELKFTGGSPVTSFDIIITSPNSDQVRLSPNISSNQLLYEGLEPNTQYFIQIEIENEIGTSFDNVTMTTKRGPPSRPLKPAISDIQIHSVHMSFTIASVGSETIDYYLVNISNGNREVLNQLRIESSHDFVLSSTQTDSNGQSVVLLISPLDSNTVYSFSVSAGGTRGNGMFSEHSDNITTQDGNMIYYIIFAVIGGALCIIVVIAITALLICFIRNKRRKRTHTITARLHLPNDFVFPSSSMSNNPDIIGKEEDTPISSPLEIVKEDIPLTFHNNSINIPHHHQRTQSTSSNNSGHMIGHGTKRDLVLNMGDISDSAYGGSTEKVPNHVYAEIHGPRSNSKTWFSSPSINKMSYFDVDRLPPKVTNFATDV